MKKLYALLVFVLIGFVGHSQIVNIPDANFRTALLNYQPAIDTDMDGQIEVSEALAVTVLDFSTAPNYFDFNLPITSVTGIEAFTNLVTLKLYLTYLTSLNISALTSLQTLDLNSNNDNALQTINLSGLTNLKKVAIYNYNLSSIDLSGLIHLEDLGLGSNPITSLDVTGLTSLKKIQCSYSHLTHLGNLAGLPLLTELYCSNNMLTSIDLTGATALTSFSCNNNSLTSLDLSSQTNLTGLDCSYNQLSSLSLTNLTNLQGLEISGNQFTTINLDNQTALSSIHCNNNQFATLNLSHAPNLKSIECIGNLFTSLSDLNIAPSALGNLTVFQYGNPQFQVPPFNLFTSLHWLAIYNIPQSQIDLSSLTIMSRLEVVNTSLTELDISNNPLIDDYFVQENPNLVYFNAKNGHHLLYGSNIYQNPNLEYVCANESDLATVTNYVHQGTGSSPTVHVNTYCSFTPGGTYYVIKGNSHLDANGNGCDATDINVSNQNFSITDGANAGSVIADTTGSYAVPVQAGTQVITPVLENPTYFTVSPATATVTFPTATSPFVQDFCVTPNGTHNDLEVALLPMGAARPGFDATYKIIYKNKGTGTQSGTVTLAFDDSSLDLVSAMPVVTSQAPNYLSWNFSNLLPFESREIVIDLNLNSPTETPPVNGGDILNYTATVLGTTDEAPADNASELAQTVVNSFDPNDKTCVEGTTITPSMVGQYVHYVIRFENDGTANAQNIVVKDMIDATKFDVATLVPLSGSASYTTRIINTSQVEFIFQNINLPYAAGTNTGYVAFKIKTKPTLVVGDAFSNSASIFFDYNAPIDTNIYTTAVQVLATQDFDFGTYFSIYPNPAKQVLNLQAKAAIRIKSISIYNLLGQMVIAIPNAESVSAIDVSDLKTGTYFIKVTTDKGTANAKFIKE